MELNLHKVGREYYLLFLMFIGLISGSFLFLAIFFKPFFYKVDAFRLIFISIGISFPLTLINGFFVSENLLKDDKTPIEIEEFVGVGLTASLMVFYIPSVLGFFFELTGKKGVLIGLGVEVIILLFFYIIGKIKTPEDSSS